MSFHVGPVSRWMHYSHASPLPLRISALEFNVTLSQRQCRAPFSSVAFSNNVRTRQKGINQLVSRSTSPWAQILSIVRPIASSAVGPLEQVDEPDVLYPAKPTREHLNSQATNPKGLRTSERNRRRLQNASKLHLALSTSLGKLPVDSSFAAHPGTFPTLPFVFGSRFSAVFDSYCESKSSESLREEFAEEVAVADALWEREDAKSLESWLSGWFDSHQRVDYIVGLLLGSLVTSAPQMLRLLRTLQPIENDFEIRASCLYLTGYLYKSELLGDPALMASFDSEIDRLRSPAEWSRQAPNLDHLRLLLWRSNSSQRGAITSALQTKYGWPDCRHIKHERLGVRTSLWLTMFCASNEMPEQAFAFFKALPRATLRNPDTITYKCCAQLLKHDTVVQTEDGANFRYLPTLLERGFPPNNLLYSRIVERALDSGYPGVAWDVYKFNQTSNVDVYWRTHLLLLRHSFLNRNAKGVDEIMSQIYSKKELYTNSSLLMYAMNMIRTINHSSPHMTASAGLSHILALYDRVYTRAPLSKFGFAPEAGSTADSNLQEPDTYLLTFTVWAYILCHKHASMTDGLWKHILNLIESADPVILECMKLDLIYNAFIWLHLKDPVTLGSALEILHYMIGKQLCPPTPRTWSILICGFLQHGHRSQAKQIYELMQAHGFSITNICEEFLPDGISLEDLEGRMNQVLDERSMPDGTDLNWTSVDRTHDKTSERVTDADLEPGSTLYSVR